MLDPLGSRTPLLVLQSSAAQSSLPLLNWTVNRNFIRTTVLLCCILYPPQALVNAIGKTENIIPVDCTGGTPGYGNSSACNHREVIMEAIDAAPEGALVVIIDSVEAFASDLDSSSKAVVFLSKLLSLALARSASSQLILHTTGLYSDKYGDILPRITSTQFSSTLLHVVSHPPILLRHLAEAYSTPPPPMSSPEKFWSVFTPFVTRGPGIEAEALVFGPNGNGSSSSEMVLEVLYRGINESGGTSRKLTRGVDRSLEGWREGALCALSTLPSLSSVFKRKASTLEHAPKQAQDLSFNLNLTSEQQQKRAEVPLPYEHTGLSASGVTSSTILYDPDSADDIDDDDPDEDLDI